MPTYSQTRTGFRSLLIDYDPDDYNPALLQSRLEDFYRKLVRNREGSDFLNPEKLWIDDLSDSDIPFAVTQKIKRRVKRYQLRRKKLSGVSHLRTEDRDTLKSVLPSVSASYIDDAGADSLAAVLHDRYPWMSYATEHVWLELRQSARTGAPACVSPVLLDGPPGIGKSAWARSLATHLRSPFALIDASASNSGFAVSGTEKGFGSAQSGRPVELLIQHRHANSVIVVDEIDKAGIVETTRGMTMSISQALLGLLEPVSAARWECPFYRVPFDLSPITWVLTSNRLALVPEPLRTRCTVVKCSGLSIDHMLLVGGRLCDDAGLSVAARDASLEAIQRLPDTLRRPADLRDVRRVINRAQALETRPIMH
ncbi:MAG: AAA family ATPase [Paracoccaceae bacterium]